MLTFYKKSEEEEEEEEEEEGLAKYFRVIFKPPN
jgi:hypothetical protein